MPKKNGKKNMGTTGSCNYEHENVLEKLVNDWENTKIVKYNVWRIHEVYGMIALIKVGPGKLWG